jgi:hypothetical protein
VGYGHFVTPAPAARIHCHLVVFLFPLMRVRFGTSTKRGAVFCGLWGSQACGSNVDHLVFFCAVCAQAVVAGRRPKAPRAAFEWEQRGERPVAIVRVHGASLSRFASSNLSCLHAASRLFPLCVTAFVLRWFPQVFLEASTCLVLFFCNPNLHSQGHYIPLHTASPTQLAQLRDAARFQMSADRAAPVVNWL